QRALAVVGGGQALGDLLLPLLNRVEQRRPHEGGDQPDQACEGQRLGDSGEVDAHRRALPVLGAPRHQLPGLSVSRPGEPSGPPGARFSVTVPGYGVRSPTRNGWAKANSRPTPTLKMNAASTRPAVMNMRTCGTGISSGWRAADSRNLPAMMAMPRPAPSAARPTMRPTAMAVEAWTEAMRASAVSMVVSRTAC